MSIYSVHEDYVNDLVVQRGYDRVCTASDDGRIGILGVDGNTCAVGAQPLRFGSIQLAPVRHAILPLDCSGGVVVQSK